MFYTAWDANGRPGPGKIQGNLQWVGNVQECMRVKATGDVFNATIRPAVGPIPPLIEERTHDFDGKYCRVYWPLLPPLSPLPNFTSPDMVTYICTCTVLCVCKSGLFAILFSYLSVMYSNKHALL